MRSNLRTVLILGLLSAGQDLAAAERVDYVREIKPLLTARCYACHGALQQKSGLRLDTARSAREGGNKGPVVVPGKSEESLLIDHVTGRNGARRMPPASEGETLKDQEIALLKAWIDQGAVGPADEQPEADPKEHWAFRAPVRAAAPPLRDTGRVANVIDAFIAADREKRGLVPQPPADRRLLLRRVCLDLIGLPPSREELAAFAADDSPDAYAKVVDRLLASPQYGERWGRHWMDVWRYSDWWGLGAEVRNSQKHIWHWRDWVVESLNADKGYDQMLREMLAADELYPTDPDRLRATGFLARSYFKFNRNTWLEEVVEHTSKAFLGLTLNCAKCHDHKYDPISQTNYYRFRAFFEPYQVRTDQLPGEVDFEKDGIPRVFDCNLDAPTYRFERGDEKRPLKDKPLSPGLPPLLALGDLKIDPRSLPAEAHSPGLRPFVLNDQLRAADRQSAVARDALRQVEKTFPGAFPGTRLKQAILGWATAAYALEAAEAQREVLRARAAADRARAQQPVAADARDLARRAAQAERQAATAKAADEAARAELELLRAEPAKRAEADKKRNATRDALVKARKALGAPGDSYTPLRGALKTLESNVETEESRSKPFPTMSTGRRSAMAHWLTDPRHPLTARVAVNHIWMRHFGKPLVATIFDFGRKGAMPTHPALLDYLAVELMENGWSLKHLHRLMVTSATYRLASAGSGAPPANLAADPENRWYWRMNPVRMEAQALRDGLLSLAGELDLRMGGPPLSATDDSSRRRSLYFFHSHNEYHKFLATFDDANVLECYRRSESIVPQQALALSNSRLALDMAAKMSGRLENVPDAEFVWAAFETVLAATPTVAEHAECEQALAEWTKLLQERKQPDAKRRARTNLVQALVNHNDFITVR